MDIFGEDIPDVVCGLAVVRALQQPLLYCFTGSGSMVVYTTCNAANNAHSNGIELTNQSIA